jgi:DNA-binding NarL/FixJ family response regulator
MKVRVLIADDHALMRYGLRALLEANGAEVVGEAAEGREALRMARESKPDIVIMDVTMPGMNGLEAAAAVHSKCPATRVIVLSMHADSEHVHRAFAAGASAYLIKGSASEEVIAAVRAVQAGRRYLSRELESPERAREPLGANAGPLASLSRRERQVLQLVVEGHSSSQIATIVHISPTSVYTYRSRLMKKLGVADVTALVKFAVQHGLTPSS